MRDSSHLDDVVRQLSVDFEDVLPPSLIAESVHAAVPAAGAPEPEAVEQVAREDLSALAEAVTRSRSV
jgi:hypothetical protein